MQVDLNGQVAVVTGGAHGIGRAIAQAFSDNGARVVIVDLDNEASEQAVREMAAGGSAGLALAGDVADPAGREQVAGEVVSRLGGIDILVNNAGINPRRDRRPIHEYGIEDWHAIV